MGIIRNEFTDAPADADIIFKFGRNEDVGSTEVPITLGGNYRTPFPASASVLEIVSDDVNNVVSGSGAWSIYIEGLDATGSVISEVTDLNGTTPVPTQNEYWRIYDASIVGSGVYADQSVGSHSGTIYVQETGGGDEWLQINDIPRGKGRSQISAYTVPAGKIAYIKHLTITVDSFFSSTVAVYARPNANRETPPYEPMRLLDEWSGIDAPVVLTSEEDPVGPFDEFTDIIFFGLINLGTSAISIDAQIVLEDKS